MTSELIAFTPEEKALRVQAMTLALEIESVTDAASQEKAVEAQTLLVKYRQLLESERVRIKKPHWDRCTLIDKVVKERNEAPTEELTRISRKVGDFQAIERAKMQAAEAAQKAELTRLERERSAELAKANTFEQREQVHERYAQEVDAACQAAKVQAPPRVANQIIKDEWEFEVTDAYTLAMNHRHLVKIEPKRSDIKEALKSGACQPCNGDGFRTMEDAKVTCPDCKGSGFYRPVMGVKAWKTTKASVRATRPKEMSVAAL